MTKWKRGGGGGERGELLPDITERKGGWKEVLQHKGNKTRGLKPAKRSQAGLQGGSVKDALTETEISRLTGPEVKDQPGSR